METTPRKKKKKKNDTANHLKQSKSLLTVPQIYLLLENTGSTFKPQQNVPLSWPLWIQLRYESIWGMNREGKIQYPIMKGNQNGQI